MDDTKLPEALDEVPPRILLQNQLNSKPTQNLSLVISSFSERSRGIISSFPELKTPKSSASILLVDDMFDSDRCVYGISLNYRDGLLLEIRMSSM